jgi:hypothetical protein
MVLYPRSIFCPREDIHVAMKDEITPVGLKPTFGVDNAWIETRSLKAVKSLQDFPGMLLNIGGCVYPFRPQAILNIGEVFIDSIVRRDLSSLGWIK